MKRILYVLLFLLTACAPQPAVLHCGPFYGYQSSQDDRVNISVSDVNDMDELYREIEKEMSRASMYFNYGYWTNDTVLTIELNSTRQFDCVSEGVQIDCLHVRSEGPACQRVR